MAQYFYVIDAHSQIHRLFHAPFRPLSYRCPECHGGDETCWACAGTGLEPTKATYLFSRMVLKLIKEKEPSYLAICYDSPRDTLRRRKLSPTYKSGRKSNDDGLTVQITRIHQLVDSLGLASFTKVGYEADDLVATLATQCVSDEVHVRIISKDKDLGCLLADPRIRMFDVQEDTILGPEWIQQRFGLKPEQLEDYLAMAGDGVDGIKGIVGCGPKTALKLLGFGSLDQLLANPTLVPSNLRNWIDLTKHPELPLSRALVRLERDVPLQYTEDSLVCKPNLRQAAPHFRKLGFKRWDL